jgi:PilZ domain-containing protein
MKERRQYERLTLPLPLRVETITLDRKRVFDFETRDISASGVFVNTLSSFPEGTRFVLDFTIPSDRIEELKDVNRLKGCTGRLVRSTSKGMAIQFDRECQIASLKGS